MDVLAQNYAATIGSWRFDINLNDDLNNYKLIGFGVHRADKNPWASPQVFVPLSSFKTRTSDDPVRLIYDLYNPSDSSKGVYVSFVNATTVGLFMGNTLSQNVRLAVFGIK